MRLLELAEHLEPLELRELRGTADLANLRYLRETRGEIPPPMRFVFREYVHSQDKAAPENL